MKRLSCILFVLFGCDARITTHRGAPELRKQPLERPEVEHAVHVVQVSGSTPETLADKAFELGKQTAELKTKTEQLRERQAELESVVFFTDCLERHSKKSAKEAFKRGTFNEKCRAETQKLSADEIHEVVAKILAQRKKTP
jgi:hypothetical protein